MTAPGGCLYGTGLVSHFAPPTTQAYPSESAANLVFLQFARSCAIQELMFASVSPDQYLYHYTRSSTAIDHILPDMRLRFSRLSHTNDPRENKEIHFGLVLSENEVSGFDLQQFRDLVTRNLKTRVRILCLTADPVQWDEGANHVYERGFCHSACGHSTLIGIKECA